MKDCPLCGLTTDNASTRLIKDACGHTKCRLCLLQEENGCRICQNENLQGSPHRIDCIGSFNYSLPEISTLIYENPDITPLELVVNKINHNIIQESPNESPQLETLPTINEYNTYFEQENDYKQINTRTSDMNDDIEIVGNQKDKNKVNKEDYDKVLDCNFLTLQLAQNNNQLNTKSFELCKKISNNTALTQSQSNKKISVINTYAENSEQKNEFVLHYQKSNNDVNVDNRYENNKKEINSFNEHNSQLPHALLDETISQSKNNFHEFSNECFKTNSQSDSAFYEGNLVIDEDSEDNLKKICCEETCLNSDNKMQQNNEKGYNDQTNSSEKCNYPTNYPNKQNVIKFSSSSSECINSINTQQHPNFVPEDQKVLLAHNEKVFNQAEIIQNKKETSRTTLNEQISDSLIKNLTMSTVSYSIQNGTETSLSEIEKTNKLNKNPELILSTSFSLENETKKDNCNNSGSSPFQCTGYQSPEFKLSDYLLFKKETEKDSLVQSRLSPYHSIGYTSPEFRLTDYLLLNKKSITEEIEEIKKEENKNYKTVITPLDQFNNRNLNNLNNLEDSKLIKPNLTEKIDRAENSIRSIDLRESIDRPVESESKNLKHIKPSYVLNGTQTETMLSDKTQELSLLINDNPKEDDDKENKETLNKKEEFYSSENATTNLNIFVSVKPKTKRTKLKLEEDLKMFNHSSRLKVKVNSKNNTQIKKSLTDADKNEVKQRKYDRQMIIQKNQSKNKKVLIFKDENEKKIEESARKRGRPSKDWSHIVALPGNPAKYRCTFCEKVFKSLRCRCYHSNCPLGKTPFQCRICDKTFIKRSHFEYHERIHTGDKPFQCDLCHKSFIQKNKLNRHMFIHKQKNEIECNECGKKFNTKEYLKNHLAIHLKNSFKCKFCSKTFTVDHNRRRHEKSHLADKPFKCDICTKDFRDKFLLTRHKRIHEKSRPFSCHICHRVFLGKSEMQRHMAVHSDMKPFSCDHCNLEFRRKDNLNRHVKHHHSGDRLNKQIDTDITNIRSPKTKKYAEDSDNKLTISPKPSIKPKRISRSSSTSSKSSSKSSQKKSKLRKNRLVSTSEVNNESLVMRVPINITRFTECNDTSRSRLTETIPLEEALVLNRQIEERIYTQSSFCNFPGLTRRADSPFGRKSNCNSSSNSNDGIILTNKQNQERSKTGVLNKDQNNKEWKILRKDINVHWRRRTAESLKPKMTKK